MLRKILKSAAILASGTAAGQMLVLALSPVLTRLYSPSEFGVFGVYVAVLYMLLSFSSLRYEVAIPLAKSDKAAKYLTAIAICITVFFAALLIPLIGALQLLHKSNEWWVFQWFLPLGVVAAGIYNIFMYVRLRQEDHRTIARTRVVQLMTGTAFQVATGFFNAGVLGLVAGQIVGLSLGISALSKSTFVSYVKLIFHRRRYLFAQLKSKKSFALYDAPAALLGVANNHVIILLLTILFSPIAAGMYVLAQRVFVTPLGLISNALSASMLSMGRQIKEVDGENILAKQFLLLRFTAPIAVASALIAFFSFGMVFGSQWGAAGSMAAWVALFVGQKFAFDAIFPIYAIRGKLREGLISQSAIFLIRFSLLLIFSKFFSLNASVGLFSLSSSIVYLLAIRRMVAEKNRMPLSKWAGCLIDVLAPYALVSIFLMTNEPPKNLIFFSLIYAAWCLPRIGYPIFRLLPRSTGGLS
ncbi:O-antigen/teichoic acid export membrane protein [Variovorax boronicumulans]|uniref:O-antigen/teichoic acid export membrane protein n=1 Tax=Variovorax boronicumulans TaxID=436515 RepID=A0AAW8E520_9BURK|nr:oligosaccharide flippase family protein [Variovorax boronicumulans]MDP9881377.1 O-antigen/teichoic acid export membrane protein [Variovorax boronicumulans]MDP9926664.1 O-antigen/teichoic acid export membrane protein [Variovorax boronicumulans]